MCWQNDVQIKIVNRNVSTKKRLVVNFKIDGFICLTSGAIAFEIVLVPQKGTPLLRGAWTTITRCYFFPFFDISAGQNNDLILHWKASVNCVRSARMIHASALFKQRHTTFAMRIRSENTTRRLQILPFDLSRSSIRAKTTLNLLLSLSKVAVPTSPLSF